MFVTVGEYRIVIQSYGMAVVLSVAHYCIAIDRHVSFCMHPLLDTDSVSVKNVPRYDPAVLIHLVFKYIVY